MALDYILKLALHHDNFGEDASAEVARLLRKAADFVEENGVPKHRAIRCEDRHAVGVHGLHSRPDRPDPL